MRTSILTVLLLLAVGTSIPQARAAESAPSVDSILDKYVAALGGKEALQKLKSRAMKGEFVAGASVTDWAQWHKGPNKAASRFSVEGFGEISDGFDGAMAWSKTPTNVREKKGEELARVRREADLQRDLKLKSALPGLAYKGTGKLDGVEVQILESKSPAGSLERYSFDAKTGLLARQESEFEGENGKVQQDVRMSDYQEADGVKYPRHLSYKMSFGGQEYEFVVKVKEVKHGGEIEDAKFTKPSA